MEGGWLYELKDFISFINNNASNKKNYFNNVLLMSKFFNFLFFRSLVLHVFFLHKPFLLSKRLMHVHAVFFVVIQDNLTNSTCVKVHKNTCIQQNYTTHNTNFIMDVYRLASDWA